MSRREALQHAIDLWMGFWFFRPSYAHLAIMRVGVGAIVLYLFLLQTPDLEAHYAVTGWAGGESLSFLDRMAWAFSPLHWVQSTLWLYFVHGLAILSAMAFLLGLLPIVFGPLTLLFDLSYAHGNPGVVLSIDALVVLALAYLSLTPCGRTLSLRDLRPPLLPGLLHRRPGPSEWSRWNGLAMRALQIHLCILYFQSGVHLLGEDWLSGTMLAAPRVLDLETMLAQGRTLVPPDWLHLLAYVVALFHLYFGVLIWLPPFRYLVLGLAVGLHVVLGLGWQLIPFNLLMIVLNLSFLHGVHADAIMQGIAELMGLRWLPPED